MTDSAKPDSIALPGNGPPEIDETVTQACTDLTTGLNH